MRVQTAPLAIKLSGQKLWLQQRGGCAVRQVRLHSGGSTVLQQRGGRLKGGGCAGLLLGLWNGGTGLSIGELGSRSRER